jgi:hypothetical protein
MITAQNQTIDLENNDNACNASDKVIAEVMEEWGHFDCDNDSKSIDPCGDVKIDIETGDGSRNYSFLIGPTEDDRFYYSVINEETGKTVFDYRGSKYITDITFDKGYPEGALGLGNLLSKQFEDYEIISKNAEGNSKKELVNSTIKWLITHPKLPDPEEFKNIDVNLRNTRKEIKIPINDTEYFVLDPQKKEISVFSTKFNSKGVVTTVDPFIGGYPITVGVQQSPLNDGRLKYFLEIVTQNGQYPINIKPGSISSIYGELKESGLILKSYNAEDRLTQLIYGLNKEDYVTEKFGIDKPGFFQYNNTIIPVNFVCETPPSSDSVNEALNILEEFGSWFKASDDGSIEDQRDKVATVIKLSLTLPFNYVRKQMGLSEFIKPPMAYGKPGSSKTTLFLLPAYLFGLNLDEYERAGSNVRTEPRFAELIGTGTFPIMVDECQNVFMDKGLVEMNKTGLRRLNVRNKLTKHGTKIEEPAYATFLYISNFNPIANSLEENEFKDGTLQTNFDNIWKMREPRSPLKNLISLGRFAAYQIIQNPDLLHLDPTDLGDKLISMIYEFAERPIIPWMEDWADDEGIHDYHQKEEDLILEFIHKSVMDAYSRKTQLIDDEGRHKTMFDNHDVKKKDTFQEIYFDVANGRFLPWFFLKEDEYGHNFFIKPGFAEELGRYKDLKLSLKSISQKFGWNYGNFRDDGKQQKMIKISHKQFYDKVID